MPRKNKPRKSTSKTVEEEPEVEEFMETGDSPVTGITLRQVLRKDINLNSSLAKNIFWSPNARYLALSESGGPVRIWDIKQGNDFRIAENFKEDGLLMKSLIGGISWSPNGEILSSIFYGVSDPYPQVGADIISGHLQLWDIKTRHFQVGSSSGEPIETSWSPDGSTIAAISTDGLNLVNSHTRIATPLATQPRVTVAAWAPRGDKLALGPKPQIFIPSENRLEWDFDGSVDVLAWHPDGNMLAGGSATTIHVWDVKNGVLQIALEGHTARLRHLAFSSDGRLLISASANELRLWRVGSWESTSINDLDRVIGEHAALHPHLPFIASVSEKKIVRVWKLDYARLLKSQASQKSIQYTTAKLVIVGDSGVGKTGLGWRLTHNEFKEHSSTHGQQFWIAPALSNKLENGTECEAVVWDLAGQHVYRAIHSIFLDNVDTSLILFDPTNRQDPLKGAQFWLEQLKGNQQLPPSVLVGARIDRGTSVLSQEELAQFCQKYGVSGGYIGTSAKSGEGVDVLIDTIKKQIPWEKMAATVTTITFKKIKEFVLSLKENPDRKGVLVKPETLHKMLAATDVKWKFSDAEMMTAVGHLANHGYVNILRNSSGEEYILLAVDLLAYLASSIVLLADKHPKELGAVSETDILQGKYPFAELNGLDQEEQQILIDAAILRFLENKICFREKTENDTLLIFPSLIKQKKPLNTDEQTVEGTSYIIRGSVENLYARMVVLLGYTPSFMRVNQWQNQSQFMTGPGNICGFRLIEDHEGEIELVLYYGNHMPARERDNFQVLFERFLYQNPVEITPFPSITCPNGHPQERATVLNRSREGKKMLFCAECGAPTDLPVPKEQKIFDFEIPEWLKREEAMAQLRGSYEMHLASVKSYRREWATQRCYLSFAVEQKDFAEMLKDHLSKAGISVLDEQARVEENDTVLIISSQEYNKAMEIGSLLEDKKLIVARAKNNHKGIITIKQDEKKGKHDIDHCESDTFSDETHHLVNLFDLVLHLYSIPLDHAGFKPLRQSLHQQWEQTLSKEIRMEKSDHGKEIFLSYAWGGESEILVDKLDHAFQERGITIVRDKRDLGFKGRIKGFMETIGKGKAVILVISEKYLKSENCMFELLQVAKQGDFAARIFPVVLNDAHIYKAKDRLIYTQHWDREIEDLEAQIKNGSVANIQGITDDLNLYTEIRANIATLTETLKDMNTLTPGTHEKSGFQEIFDAVMAKVEE